MLPIFGNFGIYCSFLHFILRNNQMDFTHIQKPKTLLEPVLFGSFDKSSGCYIHIYCVMTDLGFVRILRVHACGWAGFKLNPKP